MIHLTTGLPGDGKTLLTIAEVDALAKKSGRVVYYSGIKDLNLPWLELDDPTKWHELPDGSIIVIDECQRAFRPRHYGKDVPAHVEALETHRHGGRDLFLITQHPMLVDSNVRRLVGRHRHVVRNFGMQRATIHEWPRVRENCDKSREDSVRFETAYPVEYFKAYHSAEVHTHKRRVPMRVFLLAILPFVIAGCLYAVYRHLQHPLAKVQLLDTPPLGVRGSADPVSGGRPGATVKPPLTPAQYVAQFVPRVPDLPESAPLYDALTTPKAFPLVSACVMSKRAGCKCYTQQGTPIAVSELRCTNFVAQGSFDQYRETVVASNGATSPAERPLTSTEAKPPQVLIVEHPVTERTGPVKQEIGPVGEPLPAHVPIVPGDSPFRFR